MNTSPHIEQHAVLAVFDGTVGAYKSTHDIEVFHGSWDACQYVWSVLEGRRQNEQFHSPVGHALKFFCVRAVADPRVQAAVRGDKLWQVSGGTRALVNTIERYASYAQREYVAKRIGAIASEATRNEALVTLSQVRRAVREQLRHEGISPTAWSIDDAIKARIILGRVPGTRRAYFMLKKHGPLYKVRVDGQRLGQTTLALNAEFRRLTKDEVG